MLVLLTDRTDPAELETTDGGRTGGNSSGGGDRAGSARPSESRRWIEERVEAAVGGVR